MVDSRLNLSNHKDGSLAPYGGHELANAFRTVRKNTIKTAEDISDAHYGLTAAPGMRTVAQILAHSAYNSRIAEDIHRTKRITGFEGYNFVAVVRGVMAEEAKLTTKPALLAERVENFDKSGSRARLEMLLSPKEHEMHQRGQLMVAQRIVGVVPHLTREREARMAVAAALAKA